MPQPHTGVFGVRHYPLAPMKRSSMRPDPASILASGLQRRRKRLEREVQQGKAEAQTELQIVLKVMDEVF